jgi:tetratricopeptide (TPR) repeat protein
VREEAFPLLVFSEKVTSISVSGTLKRHGITVEHHDIRIHHVGYLDPALRRRKLERDLRLLRLEKNEQPDHPFTLFNLGSVLLELGQHREALALLRGSLERSHVSDSIVRKLYALIAYCHQALGERPQALHTCTQGRAHYADDAELLYLEAQLRREQRDLAGAERWLLELLAGKPQAHFASVTEGMRSYRARHLLGLVYQDQGRWQEAEQQWRLALAEKADFLPAQEALAALRRREIKP